MIIDLDSIRAEELLELAHLRIAAEQRARFALLPTEAEHAQAIADYWSAALLPPHVPGSDLAYWSARDRLDDVGDRAIYGYASEPLAEVA